MVTYSPPSSRAWKTVSLTSIKGTSGFGGVVPCEELTKVGTLRYTLLALDAHDVEVISLGSRSDPIEVTIKPQIDGDPPHLPDQPPPESCGGIEDEGPGQCIDNTQCSAGFTCEAGACVAPSDKGPAEPSYRKNWVDVALVPDLTYLGAASDICTRTSQTNDHYVCYGEDGQRYRGSPVVKSSVGPTADVGDRSSGGFAFGTLRLQLGYTRMVQPNLSVGGRIGATFRNDPGTRDDGFSSFLANFSVEGRGTYWMGSKTLRVGIFLVAGAAELDGQLKTPIVESGVATSLPRTQQLTAYRLFGSAYTGGGAGLSIFPNETLAINLGLRGSVMFPLVTAILSPEIGVSMGF
jgi:hypothetical protein